MFDQFKRQPTTMESPAENAETIATSDTVDLAYATRAIYIGVGGDLKVTMVGGQVVTFTAVPQGAMLPIRATRVWLASTATSLVGVW